MKTNHDAATLKPHDCSMRLMLGLLCASMIGLFSLSASALSTPSESFDPSAGENATTVIIDVTDKNQLDYSALDEFIAAQHDPHSQYSLIDNGQLIFSQNPITPSKPNPRLRLFVERELNLFLDTLKLKKFDYKNIIFLPIDPKRAYSLEHIANCLIKGTPMTLESFYLTPLSGQNPVCGDPGMQVKVF